MNKIKELRKSKGWNQTTLAKKLSTTQANVSAWEKSKWYPDIDSLKTMSNIFEVTIDYILDNEKPVNELQVAKKEITPDLAKQVWFETLTPVEQLIITTMLRLNEVQQLQVQSYMQGMLSK